MPLTASPVTSSSSPRTDPWPFFKQTLSHQRTFAIVYRTNIIALLTLPLILTACTSSTPNPHNGNLDWNIPGMQLGGDHGLPLRAETPCRKRGCDNHKLFFNPATPEPSVNTIHRGW